MIREAKGIETTGGGWGVGGGAGRGRGGYGKETGDLTAADLAVCK